MEELMEQFERLGLGKESVSIPPSVVSIFTRDARDVWVYWKIWRVFNFNSRDYRRQR